MKVKVLFSYTAEVVPPRCRKPQLVLKHDGVVEVEIPEHDPTEAPVALKVRKPGRIRPNGTWTTDVMAYRWFNGELWTNFRTYGCSRMSFVSGKTDWLYRRPPKVMDLRSETQSRTNGYRHGLVLKDHNSLADLTAQIEAWSKDLLILKGLPGIWSTASEPRYVVMTFGLGSNHGGTALMLDCHYNSNISKDRYHSAVDFAKAKAQAIQVAKQRGDNKSLPLRSHGKIQVLIPEAIRCNPQKEAGEGDPFLNKVNGITDLGMPPVVTAALVMSAAVSH